MTEAQIDLLLCLEDVSKQLEILNQTNNPLVTERLYLHLARTIPHSREKERYLREFEYLTRSLIKQSDVPKKVLEFIALNSPTSLLHYTLRTILQNPQSTSRLVNQVMIKLRALSLEDLCNPHTSFMLYLLLSDERLELEDYQWAKQLMSLITPRYQRPLGEELLLGLVRCSKEADYLAFLFSNYFLPQAKVLEKGSVNYDLLAGYLFANCQTPTWVIDRLVQDYNLHCTKDLITAANISSLTQALLRTRLEGIKKAGFSATTRAISLDLRGWYVV